MWSSLDDSTDCSAFLSQNRAPEYHRQPEKKLPHGIDSPRRRRRKSRSPGSARRAVCRHSTILSSGWILRRRVGTRYGRRHRVWHFNANRVAWACRTRRRHSWQRPARRRTTASNVGWKAVGQSTNDTRWSTTSGDFRKTRAVRPICTQWDHSSCWYTRRATHTGSDRSMAVRISSDQNHCNYLNKLKILQKSFARASKFRRPFR